VTDEHAPVAVLQPSHPAFTTPNRITDRAWQGWVQERGLQFLGERDPKYRDLWNWRIPSRTIPARSAAPSWRRNSGRDAGFTSGWDSGASCRQGSRARTSCWRI
jgi:hypothetical protein